MDSANNIYIVDQKTASIKKFDNNGNFLQSIGKKGLGPGEIDVLLNILVYNDTLLVFGNSKLINKFDLYGNFSSQTPYKTKNIVGSSQLMNFTDSTFFAYSLTYEKDKDNITFVAKTCIYDYSMKEVLVLNTTTLPVEEYHKTPHKMFELEHHIASDNDKIIYIATWNKEKYLIEGFDFFGNKKIVISKNYRKIPFTIKEKEIIKKDKRGQELDFFNSMYDYRYSFSNLYVDKSNNLWVQTSGNIAGDLFSYDIFNEEGVFVAKYTFGLNDNKNIFGGKDGILYFENDYIIVVDYDNLKVDCYEYELILQ